MKLAAALLLLTCVVCLTRAADKCSFEGEEYELGATWTNECATCTCMTGKSVKCFGVSDQDYREIYKYGGLID